MSLYIYFFFQKTFCEEGSESIPMRIQDLIAWKIFLLKMLLRLPNWEVYACFIDKLRDCASAPVIFSAGYLSPKFTPKIF